MAEGTIVVAGDATIDWMMLPVEASGGATAVNWRQFSAVHSRVLPGGVLLLLQMTKECLRVAGVDVDVVGPRPPAELWNVAPNDVIHSTSMLRDVANPGAERRVLRIHQHLGYHGPEDDGGTEGLPKPLKLESDPEHAKVVVLDDAGNSFRNHRDAWPRALEDKDALVLLKLARPLAEGALWKHLGRVSDRLVAVLRGDELRRLPGVRIARSLSWERTAKDFLFHMRRTAALEPLRRVAHLVVTFDTDGAIWFRPDGEATLLYDPTRLEEGLASTIDGTVMGFTTILAATLAAHLVKGGFTRLDQAITTGLARQRALLQLGYEAKKGLIHVPYQETFERAEPGVFRSVSIKSTKDLEHPDKHFWRILTEKTRLVRARVARELVLHGKAETLGAVPLGRFGDLVTIDRAEIEAYSAIRELLREYVDNPKPRRPLCFAVFGPPGSGKSFGVEEVAKSVGVKAFEQLAFNVSQFRSYDDLVAALHRVRDCTLANKTPLAFFDEFDAALNGEPLGWLQYLLAPMQDGKFRDGETDHPIGKSVFVFAGGTRWSYERFSKNLPPDLADDAAPEDLRRAAEEFRRAKGPDFVSRLRGFIDIMGPNRQPDVSRADDDEAFVIRRALVLRSMLTRSAKAAGLIDSFGHARLDEGVLRALLFVRKYEHGMRSMEAVLDMSRIAGRWHFDVSCLPSREQLAMHVDPDEFLFLTEKERFRTMLPQRELSTPTGETELSHDARELALVASLARGIHEDYYRRRSLEGKSSDAIVAWEALSAEKQKSNLDAASDVPSKLRAVAHGIRQIPEKAQARVPDLTDAEVNVLARMEHERWCREQRVQGFVYGPKRIERTNPHLVDYDQLPAGVRQYNIEAIQVLPLILRNLGYEIFREEEVHELDDPELVDRLARVVHENYLKHRKSEGDTELTNASLRAYDQLSLDLRESNRDVARSTARKLARIGYRVRKASTLVEGAAPAPFELPADKAEELAEQEHARWVWERLFAGWTFKPGKKDETAKTSPFLVPWDQLADEIKQYDRDNVRLLPELLRQAGYEAVPEE